MRTSAWLKTPRIMITKINPTNRTITSYAIRKLTPLECFRLMGIRDSVIRLMQQTKTRIKKVKDKVNGNHVEYEVTEPIISASQQYKQAGNSIVVDVLKAIYNQLWYPATEAQVSENTQMSIFDVIATSENGLPKRSLDLNNGTKRILTTFSGYDSQLMAADALREDHPDFNWECVGWSEIDVYASKMHDLVFPQYADKALGDITKIDWHAVRESLGGHDVDLFTYSSPCQDISQAGKQMGLKEGSGSRSALLWNVADAIEVLRPKYLLQENVAALVSKKFMPDFQLWLDRLESLGYVNVWARLNAKDFGVPQNRDRVFCLSMRKDVAFDYQFPAKVPLTRTLADILEPEVDERYFLNDENVGKFLRANDTDEASFVQFSCGFSHSAAMYIKSYIQAFLHNLNLWDISIVGIEQAILSERDNLVRYCNQFLADGIIHDDQLRAMYEYNMIRTKDMPEWFQRTEPCEA